MSYDDHDDDYEIIRQKKKKTELANQRKLIRYKEISEVEVREAGSELLSKIVAVLPKYFNRPATHLVSKAKDGVIFSKTKQIIRISLSLKPINIVDYVVGAFQTKGWGAVHHFNDMNGYDFLDLTMPEDWLKRVLCIGRYSHKISEETEPKIEEPKQVEPQTYHDLPQAQPATDLFKG